MARLLNIMFFFIFWLPNVQAQKKINNGCETKRLYAKILEAQTTNRLISLPKGIATNNSLLNYISMIKEPSGFKHLDSFVNTSNWSYIKNVDIIKFYSKDKQIKPKELFTYFIEKPKKIKIEDYFLDFSPVIFSDDMSRACFIVQRSQNGVMVYFYEKKSYWKLVKAETIMLF